MATIPSTVPAPWRAVLAARASSAATLAVAAIPGALDLLDGLEAFHAVDVAKVAPSNPDAAMLAARAELVTLAKSGRTLTPDDLLDRARSIAHAGATAETLLALHRSARADIGRTLGDVLAGGSPAAFGILAAELARILDEARAVRVAKLTTADAALRSGRADDWARASALADQLADVWRAAALFHDAHAERVTQERAYPIAARMRGAGDWPGWADYQRRGMTNAGTEDAVFAIVVKVEPAPWPELNAGATAEGRVAWLKWAAHTHGPTPWVPTPGELAGELEQLTHPTRAHLLAGGQTLDAAQAAASKAEARDLAERRAIGHRIPTDREQARALKRAANNAAARRPTVSGFGFND